MDQSSANGLTWLRVCAPEHADTVPRALDTAAAQASASRATRADAKSVARVAGSLAAGSLAVRRAVRTALPAFTSSRVESERIVRMLSDALAYFMSPEELVAAVDVDTAAALTDLESQL